MGDESRRIDGLSIIDDDPSLMDQLFPLTRNFSLFTEPSRFQIRHRPMRKPASAHVGSRHKSAHSRGAGAALALAPAAVPPSRARAGGMGAEKKNTFCGFTGTDGRTDGRTCVNRAARPHVGRSVCTREYVPLNIGLKIKYSPFPLSLSLSLSLSLRLKCVAPLVKLDHRAKVRAHVRVHVISDA